MILRAPPFTRTVPLEKAGKIEGKLLGTAEIEKKLLTKLLGQERFWSTAREG
jgi:hypothetical protein